MATAEKTMLYGTVEMDETYIGGIQRGHQTSPDIGKAKSRSSSAFVSVAGRLVSSMRRMPRAERWRSTSEENVSEDVDVIVTDEFNAYPTAMKAVGLTERHKTIKHKAKVYVDGDIHTNTVESSFSLLSGASSVRGIGFLQSILRPTLRK